MIDLHSHILPGIDDGAADLDVSLEMARIAAADGVLVQACTPHILPGVYPNEGPGIRAAVAQLQRHLDDAGIQLKLTTGADNHLVFDLVAGLKSGRLLSLGDTRYVLVEPPHHVAPPRLTDFFFNMLIAGYVPILTHPERLTWIESHYATIAQLCDAGVWMQVTAGSLTGAFGRRPSYWAEKMLVEGRVHILASDAHGVERRRPNMGAGRRAAARLVGDEEAERLVAGRPRAILMNEPPASIAMPAAGDLIELAAAAEGAARAEGPGEKSGREKSGRSRNRGARRPDERPGLLGRIRALFHG